MIVSLMPYNRIITKKDNDKTEELGIDFGLRVDMVCFIRDRIIHNLEATRRFLELEEEDYDDICAGIYTSAVEEYGKIILLNRLSRLPPPNSDRLKVPYTHDKKGFLDHKRKFPLALKGKEALPEPCRMLRRDFKKGDFYEPDFVMGLSADFVARLSIFYADFNEHDNYNSIKQPTKVDRPILKVAVDGFLKFIKEKKYPGC